MDFGQPISTVSPPDVWTSFCVYGESLYHFTSPRRDGFVAGCEDFALRLWRITLPFY
jgi:hypothetical protein